MPVLRELRRDGSSSRIICDMLTRTGPMTQEQLAARVSVTVGCTCKCLQLLVQQGYVSRTGRAPNSKGTTIGMRPWLYARTPKELPTLKKALPPAPTARELCDIMNAMIRRSA